MDKGHVSHMLSNGLSMSHDNIAETIKSLDISVERGIYNQVYVSCAAVTGALIFLSFNYPLLFATYLISTSFFLGAWYLNSYTPNQTMAKWLALAGMYFSANVAILTSGGVDHPSIAWLIVLMIAVTILRDIKITTLSVGLVLGAFAFFMYINDSAWQRDMTIGDVALLTRIHQILQLAYVMFVVYAFTNIRYGQQQTMRELLVGLAQTNDELRRAEIRAEQASIVKTQFLSNMSHEIRTPLNGLNGMLNLLLESPLDEKSRHFVEIALDSNKRLLELANDILDITRIEARSLELYPTDTNIDDILGSIESKMRDKADRKELAFHWEQDIHLPWLYVDGQRLGQIVQNICDNAIKYTHVGRVAVHIHDIALGNARRELNISVVDTGIGIDEEKLDYYLSPFTQEDMSLTRNEQGAGLGLAIVNQLLVVMGGSMEVNSDEARGTQFVIKIPVDIARDSALQRNHDAAQPREKAAKESLLAPATGLPCVLLIEDDDNNIRLLEMLLRDYNVDIVIAYDGAEALEKLKTMPRCDLMFVDYYMPIMDGYEFLKRLRQERIWNDSHVVAVTGSLDKDVRQRWEALGVDDIISKPIQTSAFEAILERYLGDSADPSISA